MNEPLRLIRSPLLCLPAANVDTDQIVPARFLTTTGRDGLGAVAFAEWRLRPDGTPDPDCPLNDPRARDCAVLVAGDNFGCGSSREHAAWALKDLGIRAVVSTRIADIFRRNAIQNGILPIVVDPGFHAALLAAPFGPVTVDVDAQTVALDGAVSTSFEFDAFSKHCLTNGIDELDWLTKKSPEIERYEERHHG